MAWLVFETFLIVRILFFFLVASPKNSSGESLDSQYGPVKLVFSEEEHRARSYTDSEGFFEEVCYNATYSLWQLKTKQKGT